MSLDQNLGSHLQPIDLIPMASITATGNGTGVDVSQFVGSIAVSLAAKNTAGTSPTLDVKLQESDDDSTYTDITGATFTQVTATDSFQKIGVDVRQTRGYLRYVGTIGGTTPSFTMGVSLLGIKERN